MEITDRIENPLLSRVELTFKWSHDGEPTPSRTDMLNQIASMEPGANRDLVVIKNVVTRFGVATTTGVGFVYQTQEAMSVEPDYIHNRFKGIKTPSSKDEPAAKADVSGGEE